jgi:hypothetical protein
MGGHRPQLATNRKNVNAKLKALIFGSVLTLKFLKRKLLKALRFVIKSLNFFSQKLHLKVIKIFN